MFYQEDLSTNKINPKQSSLNYKDRVHNTQFLQVNTDNRFEREKIYSLDSYDCTKDDILNINSTSNDNTLSNIDFIKYSIKSENIDNQIECNNQIILSNVQKLNQKVQEFNKKINFINSHSLNLNPQVNLNIISMIENFDLIISQINSDIIAKGQLTPKSTKNNGSKKIFEYEL